VPRAAATLLIAIAVMAGCSSDHGAEPAVRDTPHQAATYEYVIPRGTGQQLDDGAVIELMPQHLAVKVGESIFIDNQDDRDHNIGPYFVAAGQSLAMRFNRVGVLSGRCEMNPAGTFEITITE
jgi:hypothetical protein